MQQQPLQTPILTPTKRGKLHATILSIFICLGASVFSYNTVCLTQLGQLLRLKNHLTKQQYIYQLSVATSCFNLGAFISPIFYKKFVGYFGELKALLIIDVIGIIAILVELIELQFYIIASARFVLGFTIGISTAILPVYINSISPPSMIGKLGTYNQLLQTCGVVVAYVGGSILNNDVSDYFRWRIYLGFPIVALIGRIIGVQVLYRFQAIQRHIENGQIEQVKRYCSLIYGDNSQQTIQQIKTQKSFKKISQQNISTFRRRFIIALVVIASNSLSGVNAILFYAKQLFNKITDNDLSQAQLLIIIMSGVQVAATFASSLVVDRLGRKDMILNGQAILLGILFGIFVVDKIVREYVDATVSNYTIIGLIFTHLLVMNLTLGSCCIVYCAEIVADITWMIILLKGLALIIALTTDYMIEYLGIGFMFLIFFGLGLCAHVFLRPRVKETKGKTTAEIYASFQVKDEKQSILESAENDGSSLIK